MNDIANRRYKTVKHILAHEYNAIIIVSLLAFLSFIPFFTWYGFKYFVDASISSRLKEDLSNVEEIKNTLFNNQILFSIISMVAIPSSFILFGGVVGYVCELNLTLIRPTTKVYFVSIKKSFKYSLFVGFIVTFLVNACAMLRWGNGVIFSISYVVAIVLLIIFIYPSLVLIMFEGYIYQGKLLTAIKNSFLLFFVEPAFNCLIFYSITIPMIIFFVFKDYFFVYFLLLILAVYGFGILFEILSGRIFLLLDKYVNKNNYPELFEKNVDKVAKDI